MKDFSLKNIGESQFKTILQTPYVWIQKGDTLFHSAEILFKKSLKAKLKLGTIIKPKRSHNLNKKEMLIINDWLLFKESGFLFALSIENYLKGLWILKNRNNIKDFSKLPQEIKIHNLVNLCKKTNIKLVKDEEEKLKALSKTIIWFGRYPIPININDNIKYWEEGLNLGFLFEEKNGEIKLTKFFSIIIDKILMEIKLYPKNKFYGR